MSHICPLCNTPDSEHLERVPSSDIIALYAHTFGMDVAGEFKDINGQDYMRCTGCGLHFFRPDATGSHGFYAALQQFDWYYDPDKYEFRFCAKHIDPNARVLDIGCGDGGFSRSLPGREYLGLDPNYGGDRDDILPTDIDGFLETAPAPFDAVCAFQVLEHLARPADFIRKALGCLRPGGQFIVSTPSHDSFLRDVTNSPLALPPHHVTHWPDTAFSCMEKFGLTLDRLHHEPLQDVHVRWFCQKLHQYRQKMLHPDRFQGGLVDMSPAFLKLEKDSATVADQLVPVFENHAWRPAGHTVVAIFTKVG